MDEDDWYWGSFGPRSCEVIEEEDDEDMIESSILGPNGKPVYYHRPSSKQGFIGFISPDVYEEIRENTKPKRRRKRAKTS